MKRFLCYIIMASLAVGLFSGCGGEFVGNIAGGKNGVSGQAVSGEAVSGQAVSDQKDGPDGVPAGEAGKHRYCSDKCLYMETDNFGEMRQVSLRTKEEAVIPVKGLERIVFVEKDALYYTRENDDEEYYSLWRVPLVEGKGGEEKVDSGEAERVKGLSDIYYGYDAIYMDEECVVYSGLGKDELTDVIRYDRESTEKEHMPMSKRVQALVEEGDDIEWSVRYGDKLYMEVGMCAVCWDMEANRSYCVGDIGAESNAAAVICEEDAVYYAFEEGKKAVSVERVDAETQKIMKLVTPQEIDAVLSEQAGINQQDIEEYYVDGLFYYDHGLYIELKVNWIRDQTLHAAYYVFSKRDDPDSELQCEGELTDFLHENNVVRKSLNEIPLSVSSDFPQSLGQGIGEWESRIANCFRQTKGKLYLWYCGADMEKIGCFDMETKKATLLEEDLQHCYELYYDSESEY